MFSAIFVVFILIFAVGFASTIYAGFRTSRMVNKVFSLAEQEVERQLKNPTARGAASAQPEQTRCNHCGGKVAGTETQCPNCGAGLGA